MFSIVSKKCSLTYSKLKVFCEGESRQRRRTKAAVITLHAWLTESQVVKAFNSYRANSGDRNSTTNMTAAARKITLIVDLENLQNVFFLMKKVS